ncbi:MAG: type II toxin-antitoxin system VapC family toxin [Spirochaetaceae bacterium]|nr:MAG: type II toxin-antitoxin system VapC family toxin [Spirochaetaceae bacterium]
MIVDTSALIAVLEHEPERDRFIRAIALAPVRRMSSATYVEASIVASARRGPAGLHALIAFLVRAGVETTTVDADQAQLAVDAYRRYGKGVHRAALNYGDVFSYALARHTGEPLLYKGDDFVHTDVSSALDS